MAAIVIILSITFTTTVTSNAADLRNGSAFSFKLSDPKGKFNNGPRLALTKKHLILRTLKSTHHLLESSLYVVAAVQRFGLVQRINEMSGTGKCRVIQKEVQSLLINTPQPEINLIKQIIIKQHYMRWDMPLE